MSAKAKNKLTPQQRKATLNRVLHKIRPYSAFVVCSLLVAAVSVAAQLYIPILCGDAIDKMLGKGNVDLAGVLHEIVENVVFLRRERDRLAVERDALGVVVQLDPADRDDRRRLDRRAQLQEAAQLRFDPRQHLHGVEGLCDVVVRAHAQPQDLV